MRMLAFASFTALLAACAGKTFWISPKAQRAAEDYAFGIDMAQTEAAGLGATYVPHMWKGGRCRWSSDEPGVAICRTATRFGRRGAWTPGVWEYRRDSDGKWLLLFRDRLVASPEPRG